jgi:hypothetical protein
MVYSSTVHVAGGEEGSIRHDDVRGGDVIGVHNELLRLLRQSRRCRDLAVKICTIVWSTVRAPTRWSQAGLAKAGKLAAPNQRSRR